MSYILDALRRAQAQRERGSVPDIHALPQGTGAPLPTPSRAGSPLLWAAGGLVVVAAMLLAWWLLGQRQPARDVVTMAPVPAAMPAPAQSVAPVALPTPVQPQPPAPTVPPAMAATPPPLPSAAAPSSPATVAPARPSAKEPKAATPAQRPASARAAAAQLAPAPAVAPAASAVNEPRVYTRDELPSDIRGQLPQVKISGSSYSESPSSRMLIANGQVFYENEKIAPDTTLVQIRPNSAILSFRGFRYAVPF